MAAMAAHETAAAAAADTNATGFNSLRLEALLELEFQKGRG